MFNDFNNVKPMWGYFIPLLSKGNFIIDYFK